MSNKIYRVGIAREDITPPLGIRLCGYAVREGVATGIDAPLSATAMVLRGGDTTIILVGLDLTLASIEFTLKVRQACAAAAGVAVEHVLVNYNHTHSAPVMPGWMPYDDSEQLEMVETYGRHVISQSAGACSEAMKGLQEARLAIGWGECQANINRRQKSPDQTVLLGENPSGPRDGSVGVLRLDDLKGHPLAIAFRYSCHPVTLGPRTNVISPDFIARARSIVEEQLGCLSLFLQGCAGNMSPITGIGQDASENEDTVRLGQMLGGEILKVCSTLRTHRRRCEPRLIHSVATYWLYEYETVPRGEEGSIQVHNIEMELPLKPFPVLTEVREERRQWAVKLEKVQASNSSEAEISVVTRFDHWAARRLSSAESGPNPFRLRFPVQVFQIDDLVIIGAPFELLAETGLALRSALPQFDTMVLGYSNGVVTYLPTPEASLEGGMEARAGYINYLVPSEIPGDWEFHLRKTLLQILNSYE